MQRANETNDFYFILSGATKRLGPPKAFSDPSFGRELPARGVYFIFEPREFRTISSLGLRVTRVGTHGLTTGSKSTLRSRLAQHRGNLKSPGGNHRGSIFRLLVGSALIDRQPSLRIESWGQGSTASRDVRDEERELEAIVSRTIGEMKVLCIPIDDPAGPESQRGYVERNAIALLSHYNNAAADLPSQLWLGRSCPRERVRRSGLWNNNHIDDEIDPDFLNRFRALISAL